MRWDYIYLAGCGFESVDRSQDPADNVVPKLMRYDKNGVVIEAEYAEDGEYQLTSVRDVNGVWTEDPQSNPRFRNALVFDQYLEELERPLTRYESRRLARGRKHMAPNESKYAVDMAEKRQIETGQRILEDICAGHNKTSEWR